jgi:hypothetical protein
MILYYLLFIFTFKKINIASEDIIIIFNGS